MAEIPGVRVTGQLVPSDDTDTYSVTSELYQHGGYKSVSNEAGRLAITPDRRKTGMLVYQEDTKAFWTLSGGVLDANWVEVPIGSTTNFSSGITSLPYPTFTDNGDGTATIGTGDVVLYSNENFVGSLTKYSVPENTLSFTDNAEEYICVRLNTGVAEYYVETNRYNINASNVVLVYIVWRQGNELHSAPTGDIGNGLANKAHRATLMSTPYRRCAMGGLDLIETLIPNPRTITISEATVFTGATPIQVLDFDSSVDRMTLAYHTVTGWQYTDQLVYDNININPDGLGLVPMSNNNKYGVRWFYRSIGDIKQTFYVLGQNEYKKIAEAELEQPRSDIPIVISRHCMLVGRAIIQKNADSGIITSAFARAFTGTQVMPHNDTTGIEGGDSITPHYYHSDQPINTTDSPSFANVVSGGVSFNDVIEITKYPTGFTNQNDIVVTYDSVNQTISLTGTFEAYWRGVKIDELISGWTSDPIPGSPTTPMFLYYNGSSFLWSSTVWTFDMLQIAYVYFDGAGNFRFAQRECHGLMEYETHGEFHYTIGTYLRSGGDLQNYVLNSAIAVDRRPDSVATLVADEDLQSLISAKTDKLYTILNLTGSTGAINFTVDSADIVLLNGNQPYFNEWSGATWQQTPLSTTQYMTMWKMAIPTTDDTASKKYRYVWVQGQSQGTLASQQALTVQNLNLSAIINLTPEFVFISKAIIRYSSGNWTISQVDKLTGTKQSTIVTQGAYLTAVTTDDTLEGLGTTASPLSVVNWKPAVADVASLPDTGNIAGDARKVLDTFDTYYWNGTSWILDNNASDISGTGLAYTNYIKNSTMKDLENWVVDTTQSFTITRQASTFSKSGFSNLVECAVWDTALVPFHIYTDVTIRATGKYMFSFFAQSNFEAGPGYVVIASMSGGVPTTLYEYGLLGTQFHTSLIDLTENTNLRIGVRIVNTTYQASFQISDFYLTEVYTSVAHNDLVDRDSAGNHLMLRPNFTGEQTLSFADKGGNPIFYVDTVNKKASLGASIGDDLFRAYSNNPLTATYDYRKLVSFSLGSPIDPISITNSFNLIAKSIDDGETYFYLTRERNFVSSNSPFVMLGNSSIEFGQQYTQGDYDSGSLWLSLVEGYLSSYANVNSFTGAIQRPVTVITTNTTLSHNHYFVNCNSTGTITITLPQAALCPGREYIIKNINTGSVIIDGNGSDTIDGSLTKSLTSQYQSITIIAQGGKWYEAEGQTAEHNNLTNRDVAGNHSVIRPLENSTTSFQHQNASGSSIINIDSVNNEIMFGGGATTRKVDIVINGELKHQQWYEQSKAHTALVTSGTHTFFKTAFQMYMGNQSSALFTKVYLNDVELVFGTDWAWGTDAYWEGSNLKYFDSVKIITPTTGTYKVTYYEIISNYKPDFAMSRSDNVVVKNKIPPRQFHAYIGSTSVWQKMNGYTRLSSYSHAVSYWSTGGTPMTKIYNYSDMLYCKNFPKNASLGSWTLEVFKVGNHYTSNSTGDGLGTGSGMCFVKQLTTNNFAFPTLDSRGYPVNYKARIKGIYKFRLHNIATNEITEFWDRSLIFRMIVLKSMSNVAPNFVNQYLGRILVPRII